MPRKIDLERIVSSTGNAFYGKKTVLKTTSQGVRDWDATKSRTWSIVNPAKLHYSSKQPAGYKVRIPPYDNVAWRVQARNGHELRCLASPLRFPRDPDHEQRLPDIDGEARLSRCPSCAFRPPPALGYSLCRGAALSVRHLFHPFSLVTARKLGLTSYYITYIWEIFLVTRAGRFVTQSTETPKDTVVSWVAGDKPIENTDIVTYLTVGVNHIPRPEVKI
jgi:Copper amine oxidase, enzyme domain